MTTIGTGPISPSLFLVPSTLLSFLLYALTGVTIPWSARSTAMLPMLFCLRVCAAPHLADQEERRQGHAVYRTGSSSCNSSWYKPKTERRATGLGQYSMSSGCGISGIISTRGGSLRWYRIVNGPNIKEIRSSSQTRAPCASARLSPTR